MNGQLQKRLVKTGKKVGITSTGLSIKHMDKKMFERAAAILDAGTPVSSSSIEINSPEGVRKNSAAYWKSKFTQVQEKLTARVQLEYPIEEVEGLFPFKKVKPTATNRKKLTDVCGSLNKTQVREEG